MARSAEGEGDREARGRFGTPQCGTWQAQRADPITLTLDT
jgi:hypothetical protein